MANLRLSSCALLLLIGCSSANLQVSDPVGDSGDDTSPTTDVGFSDAPSQEADAAPESAPETNPVDATPETVIDTGTVEAEVDAIPADTTPEADAAVDVATETLDATPDAAPDVVAVDAPPDVVETDTATVDASPDVPDTVTADTGSDVTVADATDTGPVDTGTETASDAAPEADAPPACVVGARTCLDSQAYVCVSGTDGPGYTPVGGACNYGCDPTPGECVCSTATLPAADQFTIEGSKLVGPGGTWSFPPKAYQAPMTASTINFHVECTVAPGGGGVPQLTTLTGILAQNAPVTTCTGFDGDPTLQTFGFTAEAFWAQTPTGTFVTVNFADGTVNPAPASGTTARLVCVN